MKNLFAVIFSAFVLAVSAAEVPDDSFVYIPANPGFAFAKGMNPRSREAGEASPIGKAYCIAKYPVTNAEYQAFCKATGHWMPRYWKTGTFPEGKEKHQQRRGFSGKRVEKMPILCYITT